MSQTDPQSTAPAGESTDVLEQTIQATKQRSIRNSVADRLEVPHNKVCDLLRNVWSVSKGQPPLSDQEMFTGMSMIARFDLDPIAREVYVTRDNKGRLMTIVALDGWVKILDRTDHFDGFETEMKWEDEAETRIRSVTVTIHSKTRKYPTVYEAFEKEYSQLGGFMRGKIPLHMLRIFALRHAARLFTPLGGNVMLEEEVEWINRGRPDAPMARASHEEQAAAIKARREEEAPVQSSPARSRDLSDTEPIPEQPANDPPPTHSSDGREASAQIEEYHGMLEAADYMGGVDKCQTMMEADEVLNETQLAVLLKECDARREAIHGGRGSRSNGGI